MPTPKRADLLSRLANLTPDRFDSVALEVFRYQAAENDLFGRWLGHLGCDPRQIGHWSDIPFLPIQFFKTHAVKSGEWQEQTVFTSSSTTGASPSRHFVRDPEFYLQNAWKGFSGFYGAPSDWCVLALLPSYLERGGSSLVAMADNFIRRSRFVESGFFLHDFERLRDTLLQCRSKGYPTLLLGVSFGLLDFAEQYPMNLQGITIMETGGMKGRRRELTRSELHETLRNAFKTETIHSEYGMTELFSQAYSQGGTFTPAGTMRLMATEPNDPFCRVAAGRTGVLNIVDLANLDTCSFIATEDLGKVYAGGSFEVLGRLDAAELRGCNLMVE